MQWISVEDYSQETGWSPDADAGERSRHYCQKLEEGQILFFAGPPFHLPPTDRQFLISQRQSGFKGHKNISYRPANDELRGAAATTTRETCQLHAIMRIYSQEVTKFVDRFLAPYAGQRKLDFASFRSIEEHNRDLSTTKRNDLMHVDAFPTRPTHGGRILRVFTNVNPQRERVWETSDGFSSLARRFADGAGLRHQKRWTKYRLSFPPGSTWLVYTDQVPHAVLSGQFALEQTFIIPMAVMVAPELSPLRVLESMCGRALVAG
jgi:hypothetical protein